VGILASSLAAMILVGCGDDDGGGTPDARTADAAGGADARPPDAGSPDAQAFSGTIQIHDISIFGLPQAGHGGSIELSFGKSGVPSYMSAGNTSGIPPCGVTLTDHDDAAMANPDLNEGTIKVEIKNTGGTIARPVPDCTFVGGEYRCISGMGTAGTTGAGPAAGLFTFMGTGQANATAGDYVVVTGGDGAGLAMPIVNVAGATSFVVASLTGAAPPASVGSWITAAGLGPTPPAPTSPEFLADDNTVKVTLTGATGTHFGNVATGDIQVGDAFEVDDATAGLLAADLNLATTSALVFGCKKTAAGNTMCPPAAGIIVNIQSTDATSFTGPTDMGTPDRFTGNLTCAAFAESVSIPANLFAVLAAGNPTKLRISVLRDFFSPVSGNGNGINVVVGHAVVAFQDLTD
jgi:hypothetical protein